MKGYMVGMVAIACILFTYSDIDAKCKGGGGGRLGGRFGGGGGCSSNGGGGGGMMMMSCGAGGCGSSMGYSSISQYPQQYQYYAPLPSYKVGDCPTCGSPTSSQSVVTTKSNCNCVNCPYGTCENCNCKTQVTKKTTPSADVAPKSDYIVYDTTYLPGDPVAAATTKLLQSIAASKLSAKIEVVNFSP